MILVLSSPATLVAQGADADLMEKLEALKRASDGGRNSRDVEASENRAKRRVEQLAEGLNPVPVQDAPTTTPERFEHVIVKGGVPFPESSQIVLEPEPTLAPLPTPDMREYEASRDLQDYSPYRPPRCEQSVTKVQSLVSNASKQRSKVVYYDTLYLPEDMVPIDVSEVFGQETKLVVYGAGKGEAPYLHMKLKGVPCLPFRLRITDEIQYLDYGQNAYKNYDADPAGQGTVHSWVKKKLGEH
jgi:hypothetical protein